MSGPWLLSAGRALNASIVPSMEYAVVSPTITTSLMIATAVAVGCGEPGASPLASTLADGRVDSEGSVGVGDATVGPREIVGDSDGEVPADPGADGSTVPPGPVAAGDRTGPVTDAAAVGAL